MKQAQYPGAEGVLAPITQPAVAGSQPWLTVARSALTARTGPVDEFRRWNGGDSPDRGRHGAGPPPVTPDIASPRAAPLTRTSLRGPCSAQVPTAQFEDLRTGTGTLVGSAASLL